MKSDFLYPMQTFKKTPHKPVLLSDLDKARLEKHAPFFGIALRKVSEHAHVLSFQEGPTVREVTLASQLVHIRLLAELCERTVPWICFSVGNCCSMTYFNHCDAHIKHFAQLYRESCTPDRSRVSEHGRQ